MTHSDSLGEELVLHTLAFRSVPTLRREERSITMPITTLKVLASLIRLHGPGATIQSDHQGIDALLNDMRANEGVVSDQPVTTQVAFRRGGFAKGANAGGFRRAGWGTSSLRKN
jgi:hypothetical protein